MLDLDFTCSPQVRSNPAAPLRSLVASLRAPRVGESPGSSRPWHLGEHGPGILRNVPRSGFVRCLPLMRLGCGWGALPRHPDTHVTSLVALTFRARFRQPRQAAPVSVPFPPPVNGPPPVKGTASVYGSCAASCDLTASFRSAGAGPTGVGTVCHC